MTYGKPITGPINLAELEERWIKEGAHNINPK